MRRVLFLFTALFVGVCLCAPAAAVPPTTGIGQLAAPEAAVVVINAVVTLPVAALPLRPGEPVKKGTILAEMDVAKLEREMRELQRRLRDVQEEKRFRASNKEVQRGGGGSTTGGQRPDNGIETNLAIQEADAMRDMLEVQTRLSQASPRAPADGYLIRNYYAVGAEAKRRKPLVSFVAANATALAVTLPGASSTDYPAGAAVTVRSAENSGQAFRGVIVSSRAGAAELELTVRPLELPFLALDRPTPVVIGKGP